MNSAERRAYSLPSPVAAATLHADKGSMAVSERWGHLFSERQLGLLVAKGRAEMAGSSARRVIKKSAPRRAAPMTTEQKPAQKADDLVVRIRDVAAQGHCRIEIAKRLGVSAERVGNVVKIFDIAIRVPPKILPSDPELIAFMVTTPEHRDVARWFGVTVPMVEARLRVIKRKQDHQAEKAAEAVPAPIVLIEEVAPVEPVVAVVQRRPRNAYERAVRDGQLDLFAGIQS